MSASSRGGNAVSALLKVSPRTCSQCAKGGAQFHPSRRPYSAIAAVETSTPPPEAPATLNTDPASHTKSLYKIKSGIILSRPPLLMRPLTAFESAFYLYQKRLNERLTASFRKPLYFKSDTAAELDWRIKVRERRGTVGKDVGVYYGQGKTAWNDEVLVGSRLGDPDVVREKLVRDAEMRVSEDGEELAVADRVRVERPMPRITEADEKGDVRRLDRQLDRTLYLVVKSKEGWGFPKGDVLTDENLHETAARALASAVGVNMNTWIVGRVPVAHLISHPVLKDDSTIEKKGEKVFFLKGRIMAGQADPGNNTMGVTDFKWLTNEELSKELPPHYYHSVRNMMAER